ncbi:unnamed protein product, partial [Laminaria digitata]
GERGRPARGASTPPLGSTTFARYGTSILARSSSSTTGRRNPCTGSSGPTVSSTSPAAAASAAAAPPAVGAAAAAAPAAGAVMPGGAIMVAAAPFRYQAWRRKTTFNFSLTGACLHRPPHPPPRLSAKHTKSFPSREPWVFPVFQWRSGLGTRETPSAPRVPKARK